jgi:hypothetical protein
VAAMSAIVSDLRLLAKPSRKRRPETHFRSLSAELTSEEINFYHRMSCVFRSSFSQETNAHRKKSDDDEEQARQDEMIFCCFKSSKEAKDPGTGRELSLVCVESLVKTIAVGQKRKIKGKWPVAGCFVQLKHVLGVALPTFCHMASHAYS